MIMCTIKYILFLHGRLLDILHDFTLFKNKDLKDASLKYKFLEKHGVKELYKI